MRKAKSRISRELAPLGAVESSPAGTAGSANPRRAVPAGTAETAAIQASLSGLSGLPQLTRQSLPGYFHSRLAALGARQRESCDSCFCLASHTVIAGINKAQIFLTSNGTADADAPSTSSGQALTLLAAYEGLSQALVLRQDNSVLHPLKPASGVPS
jgi:hypothetical protein